MSFLRGLLKKIGGDDRGPGSTSAPSAARSLQSGGMVSLGIVKDLDFSDGDAWKGAVLGLPELSSFDDIARLLDVSPRTLTWVCHRPPRPTIEHYIHFTVPKRSGGVREISAPKQHLARIQRALVADLLSKVPLHPAATAFAPGSSIVKHASRHTRQAVVVRLDIADFFPSITYSRVRGLFASLGYSSGVATILALLATERPRTNPSSRGWHDPIFTGPARLPQGAATSPVISNLICRGLDARLSGLATRHGFTYSRYADDLTFSHPHAASNLGRLLSSVPVILREEGFTLNEAKTRVMRSNQRQIVTGLTVNDGVALPRADLRRFRAFLHTCERDGLDSASHALGKDALAYARGYTAFIAMVEPDRAAALRERYSWLSHASG